MIGDDQVLVLDVDGTLCPTKGPGESYADLQPNAAMVAKVLEYRAAGYRIVLYTARRMRSLEANVGELNAKMLPEMITWLNRHGIPFDEIHVGKPWPGRRGFYVDDRAIRPAEFLSLDADQIAAVIARDNVADHADPDATEAGYGAQEDR